MIGAVLQLDGVVVRAGGQTLLDVDKLSVAAGETDAVIGPNGAGKTTLLHVAALLRRTYAGTVMVLGQRATAGNASNLRRSLPVVFQHPLVMRQS